MSVAYDLGSDLFESEDDTDPAEALDTCRELLERVIWENSTTINALKRSERQLKREAQQRDQLEAELRLAQKLESIGQLAAGIAHEINTPTQFISDNTRFVKDSFAEISEVLRGALALAEAVEPTSEAAERAQAFRALWEETEVDYLIEEIPVALVHCQEGLQRVSKIVGSMKEFAHPGKRRTSAVDINHALETTTTVATNEWKLVADMELDLSSECPPVPAMRGEINQVFLNLIVNAAHAITDRLESGDGSSKGKITVSTRPSGEFIEIRIGDTGTGIPVEARDKLFEPFFTTKSVGKGTGQGLYIAHNVIVQKHGGSLTFETEVGVGTTFVIRLPMAGNAPTESSDDIA